MHRKNSTDCSRFSSVGFQPVHGKCFGLSAFRSLKLAQQFGAMIALERTRAEQAKSNDGGNKDHGKRSEAGKEGQQARSRQET